MSSEFTNKLLSAWNSGDIGKIADLYAKSATMVHPIAGTLEGRDAVEQFEGGMFQAFSEIKWQASSVLQNAASYAVEFQVSAKNSSPLPTPKGPVPATNKTIVLKGVSLFELDAEGRIQKERRYFDTASMFVQLGLAS